MVTVELSTPIGLMSAVMGLSFHFKAERLLTVATGAEHHEGACCPTGTDGRWQVLMSIAEVFLFFLLFVELTVVHRICHRRGFEVSTRSGHGG